MSNNNIPEKTIERLSEYRRTLMNLHRQGITHIFSHVLAGMQGITAVQVRRDLMLIGFSSDTKKGYDVEVLIDFIKTIDEIPCYSMDDFEADVSSLDINIAVLSCPSRIASDLVVPIVNAGIKGVLNFTSKPLNFPLGIVVENYDITTLLEKVAYFVKENEENNEM